MTEFSVPTHASVPVADVISARVSQSTLTLPVNGAVYTRMRHIEGIPAPGGGYSLWRLQALDSLLERLSRAQADQIVNTSFEERYADLMEEAARLIAEDNRRAQPLLGLSQGLLVDMLA